MDAGYFILEFWAGRRGIALPPAMQAHHARMLQRPAVRRMLEQEGPVR